MTKYHYQAYKEKTKEIISGEIEAESPREAREKIVELGFLPTKVYEETKSEAKKQITRTLEPQYRVKNLSLDEKIQFTSEIGVLLSSQIPIIEALNNISLNVNNNKLKKISTGLRHFIQNGSTLKEAMEKYNNIFDEVYIGLITAGEMSGDMDKTFERLSDLLRKQKALKDKIIGASIYPIILTVIILATLMIFGFWVIPKLTAFYVTYGATIPPFTQKFIGVLEFIKTNWIFFTIGTLGSLYGLILLFKTKIMKIFMDNFVLKLPILSNFVNFANLSNFMAVLGIAYEAGMPIVQAVEMSGSTIKNSVLKSKIKNITAMLNKGHTLHDSVKNKQFLDAASENMIMTGEKAGNLGQMLTKIADIFDKKVDLAIETLSRAFEPFIIIIMGIIVTILMAAFLPMIINAQFVGF